MKTNFFRTLCFAFVIFLMNGLAVNAQEPFYNTVWENGKVVSRTKHVMGYDGLYEKESVSKYTYNEEGDLLKKEVCTWDKKYKWNDRAGRYCPDYSENNWTPQYCILYKNDLLNNFASIELLKWNVGKKIYNDPKEMMLFQLDSPNNFNYLAFQKGKAFSELVNNINYDKELLARLAK